MDEKKLKKALIGKFWPDVRARIWLKAEELHAADFYGSHKANITKPTRRELRHDGYFYKAKCLVLRELNKEKASEKKALKEELSDYDNYVKSYGEV